MTPATTSITAALPASEQGVGSALMAAAITIVILLRGHRQTGSGTEAGALASR